jgi:large subunit ribosomal protein L10
MSKPVKNWMIRDYQQLLGDHEDALLISIRGMGANDNNEFRQELAGKDIHVTVIRNNLARKAFEGSQLAALSPLLNGPSALAFGGETVVDVARVLVDEAKKHDMLELKGAVLDGMLFEGEEGVKALSKFPTRDEAIAKVVTVILSPARNIAGAAMSPASNIAGILKALEAKLEKGETVAKVS